jgi:hypothetical protein
MPIQIYDKSFTDLFGNSLTYYKTNAGDPITLDLNLRSSIRISSNTNPLFLDASINQITSSSQSWIEEGFRTGDSVDCKIYSTGGSVVHSWTTGVLYVDDLHIDLSSVPYWIDLMVGEFIVIEVTDRSRATLEVLLNHSLNSTVGLPFSLIDGESTRVRFDDTDAMDVGDTISGIKLINQSGQFLFEATLTRNENPSENVYSYNLSLYYLNSGVYNSDWFLTADCLKTFVQLEWASLAGEPFAKTVAVFNDEGDTGYFDQPFNTGVVDAELIQGVNTIDYAVPNSFDIVVDSASTNFAIGSVYLSNDIAYYKNRPYTQQEICMAIPSTPFILTVPTGSNLNEFGAGYMLTVNSASYAGTITTFNVTFTPYPEFTAFIDSREIGDRNFKLWLKVGNLNLLAFDDQLTKEPPVGGPLVPVQNVFIDHSDNTTESDTTEAGYEANTEDDLAFCGKFLLENGALYESINYKIEAFNTDTLESFDLNNCFFNISTVPMVGGKYILNQTQTVQNTLPTTSEKRVASLVLEPSIDTLTHYGIKVYFPFLLRWEYWLQQLNANADFYPNNQTKNWVPYGNTGDWTIRLNIELVKDGLAYVFEDTIIDKDYDSDPLIVQNIQLYIDSTNTNVQVVTEGQLMRVIATHSLISGEIWDDARTWGMITVEPTESNPRFISSTVIDYDYNPSNPLIPLVGENKCKLTFPTPTQAKMECYFNPDLINLSNGVKFTTKIKGCTVESQVFKITTTDLQKLTTEDDNKILS